MEGKAGIKKEKNEKKQIAKRSGGRESVGKTGIVCLFIGVSGRVDFRGHFAPITSV